jgi:hypothetical protein
MLLTVNLSPSETASYKTMRNDIRNWTRAHARFHGRRYAQIVASTGRILDILEVEL